MDLDFVLIDVSSPKYPNATAKVSPEDYERVSAHKWHLAAGGKYGTLYVKTDVGGRIMKRAIKLHRFITGAPPGTHVDHINHDPLDNRRNNLRICTPQQNQGNARKLKPGQSKYKGVAWCAGARKWRAYIAKDRKQKHLGLFLDEREAAAAYDAAAREAFGEFAHTNLP